MYFVITPNVYVANCSTNLVQLTTNKPAHKVQWNEDDVYDV